LASFFKCEKMKIKKIACFAVIIAFFSFTPILAKKIVGLVAVRNEKVFIAQCLKGLSLYTDAIVLLDDCSTDNTLEIVRSLSKECNIEKIIEKKVWHRDEPGDRNALLSAGRKLGGTHFIMLDADELLTANFQNDDFLRKKILSLLPGEKIKLNLITLWRTPYKYRYDDSVWTNNYGCFIFCDNKKCFYSSEFIHTSRIPRNLEGKENVIEGYEKGLLHFQFVNWENLKIKQYWYKCLERIRMPEKSIDEINERYLPALSEFNLKTMDSKESWFEGYDFLNFSLLEEKEEWRKKQILEWFSKYGTDYFKDLNIWKYLE
jgi:glycosyltransferase involved in cell wall biosynthesis